MVPGKAPGGSVLLAAVPSAGSWPWAGIMDRTTRPDDLPVGLSTLKHWS